MSVGACGPFAACVRRKRIEAWLCLPMRIVNAALGGYLSEMRHMIRAPAGAGHE